MLSSISKRTFSTAGAVTTITTAIVLVASPAQAIKFNLLWSGQPFGNGASADGFIDFDPSQVPNPGETFNLAVNDFSITIKDAAIGNGTFTLSNFGNFRFVTPPNSPLDFTRELVGQTPATGSDPFGTRSGGNGGDFNIFSNNSNSAAPTGTNFFRITTSRGAGQNLALTSFAPASDPTPIPTPAPLLGAIGMGVAAVRKRMREASKETNEV